MGIRTRHPMNQQSKVAGPVSRTEVWAQLFLCDADRTRVWQVLTSECGIKPKALIRNMHMTVYHARRPMFGLIACNEAVNVFVPIAETRFMVLAPGGENPRPELEPRLKKVGIRIQKKNIARERIQELRNRLLLHETAEVLGSRRPSTHTANAFGARHFQPHLALLRPGSGIDRDLTKVGAVFRQKMQSLTFDRFCIEIVLRDQHGSRVIP